MTICTTWYLPQNLQSKLKKEQLPKNIGIQEFKIFYGPNQEHLQHFFWAKVRKIELEKESTKNTLSTKVLWGAKTQEQGRK